ncbi:hypothetical protein E8E15_006766 [Penicillium rubens]|nr:hypothetical protein E8E15_006766 [Penicillium rubens]
MPPTLSRSVNRARNRKLNRPEEALCIQNNVVRVYHTVSILLLDGRALNAGGGLCGNCTASHYDDQIFTPPYLLTQSVSEIANLHTVNADQCRIPLKLRVISFSKNIYETTLPKDSGILIPGYWMLFVMDEAGVPSVSKIMMIGLDKKRTIQPAQDPLGLLEAQSSKHESPLTFQKSW